MTSNDPRYAYLHEFRDRQISTEDLLAGIDAADRGAGIVRVDTNDEAVVERIVNELLQWDVVRRNVADDPESSVHHMNALDIARAVLAALRKEATP
jgi:hypothetical protein